MTAPTTGTASRETSGTGPIATRWLRWRLKARRAKLGSTVTLVVATLTLGVLLGRWTAPEPDGGAYAALERSVVPIALDADGIWTSSAVGDVPVSAALVALQRDDDPALALESLDRWLAAYDDVIRRLVAVEVPPEGRPVQRQFVASLTLSRDAVEVLGRAAEADDRARREGMLAEVGRLRVRSEQLMQSARVAVLDLIDAGGRVTPFQELPPFPPLEGTP
jgi:hypothetical protein